VELLVGIRRALPMTIQNEEVQLVLQRLLGQVLFYPPNVAGWPGGKNWIDSSSLMIRLRIPQLIYAADELNMTPKDDDDQMMGMKAPVMDARKKKLGSQAIAAVIDWKVYLRNFSKVPDEQLIASVARLLLVVPPSGKEAVVRNYSDTSNREAAIKSATIQWMSTPEYQLC